VSTTVGNKILFVQEDIELDLLADRLVSLSRRSSRFRTDPVAAIYSVWMELGSELASRMGRFREEERKHSEVAKQ